MRSGFDHVHDPTLLRDHHTEWDRLRRETPVFASDIAPDWTVWYVLRHDDAREIMRHPEIFSSRHVTPHTHVEPHQWIPLELDPPEHTVYRNVLNVRFSPQAVAAMEPHIRDRAAELIDSIEPAGETDFMASFARQFPTTVFMEILGLPTSETAQFLSWLDDLERARVDDEAGKQRRREASQQIYDYLGAVITTRRREPCDDLITYLIQSSIEGRSMTDGELSEMTYLLYLAGLDTVANMLGFMFWHLARHPDHRALVTGHPEAIPPFVEESLRYYSIVTTQRVATQDTTIGGCPIRKGDRVEVPWGATERDPDEFERGETFVIDRAPNRHLAFGSGPHRCLGSHLARLELAIAVEEWQRRIPDYEVAPGATITQHVGGVAGIDTLPLRWRR